MRLCLWWYWTTSYLQPNILAVWQGYCCIVTWYCWKIRTLHEFLWHPCAGAMLIFSLSFQFCYMFCFREHAQKILHIYGENFITSNAAFACGGTKLSAICSFYSNPPLPPPPYHAAALDACSKLWLDVSYARKQQVQLQPCVLSVSLRWCCIVTGFCWKFGACHAFSWHPGAEATLFF